MPTSENICFWEGELCFTKAAHKQTDNNATIHLSQNLSIEHNFFFKWDGKVTTPYKLWKIKFYTDIVTWFADIFTNT